MNKHELTNDLNQWNQVVILIRSANIFNNEGDGALSNPLATEKEKDAFQRWKSFVWLSKFSIDLMIMPTN